MARIAGHPRSKPPKPRKVKRTAPPKSISQITAEIGASIPPEAWENVPRDLSINHDHYLYGTPKVDD